MSGARAALLVGLLALGLGGCSSTGTLRYTGEAPGASPGVGLAVGSFEDLRPKGPRDLGVVRGGYGNVLKRLYSDEPVSALVERAFRDGLARRDALDESANAPTRLVGRVVKLDVNHYFRREAHTELEIEVLRGGERIFSGRYASDRTGGAAGIGIFASLGALRKMAEETLNETVDRALDDPELAAALARAPSSAPTSPGASAEERLRRVEDLHRGGLISDEELERKRREILDAL